MIDRHVAPEPRASVERFARSLSPPFWARGAQAQTLFGYFLPPGGVPLRAGVEGAALREVALEDGDRLAAVDAPPLTGSPAGSLAGTVVHLFHGLTGSTDSNYMQLVSSELRHAGAYVIGFNHRGQGPGEGLARGLYHSGSYPDLFASVRAGRALFPDAPHVGVGFSLSANTLLLGAALAPEDAPDAVLAVNPPVELLAGVKRLERGFNRIYDKNFVRGMRRSLAERQSRGWIDASYSIPRGASVRDADDAVTAPLAGYGSANEYYAACSSAPRLARIQAPAVILTSEDDPFLAADDVPTGDALGAVFVHRERTGGHLGYLTNERGTKRRWLSAAVRHYVEALARRV